MAVMAHMEQYYAVLGLRYGATIGQIKQARNGLAREWHPDRFPSDGEKVQAEETLMMRSFSTLSGLRIGQ